jgi:mannose-6-phosphate isomerase-like protein (cupin superfamily)
MAVDIKLTKYVPARLLKPKSASTDNGVTMDYYIGDVKRDGSDHDGWFVGSFFPESLRKTDLFELKYWQFKAGKVTNRGDKICTVLECTLVLSGSIRGHINGESVTISQGQYVIIEPGVVNDIVQEVLVSATGLTIKTPSVPNSTSRL